MIWGVIVPHVANYFGYSFGLKIMFFALGAKSAPMHLDPQSPMVVFDFYCLLRRRERRKEGKTQQNKCERLLPKIMIRNQQMLLIS